MEKNTSFKEVTNTILTSAPEDTREAWIEKNYPLIRSLSLPWVPSLKPLGYDEDDVVQEAMITVWKTWDTYDTNRVGILASTYFSTCINNRLCDLSRRANGKKRAIRMIVWTDIEDTAACDDESETSEGKIPAYEAIAIETEMEQVDEDLAYEQTSASLSPRCKRFADLYVKGYTMAEIAQIANCSISTVFRTFKKARTLF